MKDEAQDQAYVELLYHPEEGCWWGVRCDAAPRGNPPYYVWLDAVGNRSVANAPIPMSWEAAQNVLGGDCLVVPLRVTVNPWQKERCVICGSDLHEDPYADCQCEWCVDPGD